MKRSEEDYTIEYNSLTNHLIPATSKLINGLNDLLEVAYGYRLSEQLPNIMVQYNNASVFVDGDFRHSGIDPRNNYVRDAIRSDLYKIMSSGINCLSRCKKFLPKQSKEREVMECIKKYNEADTKLWKYDFRHEMVDHILVYFLDMYEDEIENYRKSNPSGSMENAPTVDDILTNEMYNEVLDTLKKLGFPEQVLLDFEERWHEVLKSVLRHNEKRAKRIKRSELDNIDI